MEKSNVIMIIWASMTAINSIGNILECTGNLISYTGRYYHDDIHAQYFDNACYDTLRELGNFADNQTKTAVKLPFFPRVVLLAGCMLRFQYTFSCLKTLDSVVCNILLEDHQ